MERRTVTRGYAITVMLMLAAAQTSAFSNTGALAPEAMPRRHECRVALNLEFVSFFDATGQVSISNGKDIVLTDVYGLPAAFAYLAYKYKTNGNLDNVWPPENALVAIWVAFITLANVVEAVDVFVPLTKLDAQLADFQRLRGGALQMGSCCSRRAAASCGLVGGIWAVAGAMAQALPAHAYQDIATVQAAEFREAEAAREASAQRISSAKRGFEARVGVAERAFSAAEFIEACDSLALYVIGEGRLPEGANVGVAVSRIRGTYNSLPRYTVPCDVTRDGSRECFSHGAAVEGAYAALLRVLRKYARKGMDVQMSGGTELPNFPGGSSF